jgi:hypothetical protein
MRIVGMQAHPSPKAPCCRKLSEWHTPHACTFIKTSLRLGSSTGISLIAHGAPGFSMTTARHVLGMVGDIVGGVVREN